MVSSSSLYSRIPKYNRKRIFGTEMEYGVDGDIRERDLPRIFRSNGSLTYPDCGHLEYASSETSNPLEAMVHSKAGELIVSKMYPNFKIFKNNVDSTENITFGAHESYFTHAKNFDTLIPFLVTRQIFTGAGWLKRNGSYEISQRSPFIEKEYSVSTTQERPIINTRDEALAQVYGWKRLHLIVGDANMCEIAEFLKLGTTGLVLDLIEDGLSPELVYNSTVYNFQEKHSSVMDIKNISKYTKEWFVKHLFLNEEIKATDIQREYLNLAKENYYQRDEITDLIIDKWADVLNQLDDDPNQLFGVVDWVTKKILIEQVANKKELGLKNHILRNINLQYHDIDKNGLFYTLQKKGKIERLVDENLINLAENYPPQDTRAFIRGTLIKSGRDLEVTWDGCSFFNFNPKEVSFDDPFSFNFEYFKNDPFHKLVRDGLKIFERDELSKLALNYVKNLEYHYNDEFSFFSKRFNLETGLDFQAPLEKEVISNMLNNNFEDFFIDSLLDNEDEIKFINQKLIEVSIIKNNPLKMENESIGLKYIITEKYLDPLFGNNFRAYRLGNPGNTSSFFEEELKSETPWKTKFAKQFNESEYKRVFLKQYLRSDNYNDSLRKLNYLSNRKIKVVEDIKRYGLDDKLGKVEMAKEKVKYLIKSKNLRLFFQNNF